MVITKTTSRYQGSIKTPPSLTLRSGRKKTSFTAELVRVRKARTTMTKMATNTSQIEALTRWSPWSVQP